MMDQKFLQELFEYKDGDLYWKNHKYKSWNGKKVGTIATNGRVYIGVKGKSFLAHRLIFLFHHGYLPKFLDHIDGNPLNNKIHNLREATSSQNAQNRKNQKNNTSNVKGVTWHKLSKKWQVRLGVDGKEKYFGCYYDLQVAKFVSETMRYKYHKEFAKC